MSFSAPDSPAAPAARAWRDRWLLDGFLRDAHPLAAKAASTDAPTAWEALEAAGVPPGEVAAAVAHACGAPVVRAEEITAEAADLLPARLAMRYGVVPVGVEAGVLRVACANPREGEMEQELTFATGRRVMLAAAHPAALRAALERLYGGKGAVTDRKQSVSVLAGTPEQMQARILREALAARASDVHLEPKEGGGTLVRLRVDGILHDALTVSPEQSPGLVSRFKVTAGLDIADRIRPQDGRSTVTADGRPVDLRVSTLPLEQGQEKVVVRILDQGSAEGDLGTLGFLPAELHRLERLLALREGMILVTGPTGSGKTTTLYSVLRRVQDTANNITTIEDPVEYRLEGVNQVQVNEKSGLTFASALRSMLRQDPDVILVGEIRDAETAGIALKASMTGHLVLSTLHTNDAPSAVARLTDIGVDLGALSGALKAVVAQRLLRRLCDDCSRPVTLAELPVEQQALLTGCGTGSLRAPVGCPRCRHTGYFGRMVVPEVMVVTPDLQRAIARRDDVTVLTDAARAGGMMTLWEAGVERVLGGMTSLHELLDNIAAPLAAVQETGAGQSDVDALLAQLLGGGGPPAAAVTTAASPPAAAVSVAAVTAPPGVSSAGRMRVLLVDDDREARQMLRRALEADGFAVIEAADGEAGLSYHGRLRPDWVVTEIALPRLDGIGLIQALAGHAAPVLVYTSQTDEQLLAWAQELGAAEVLHKSVDARLVASRLQARQRAAA